ncbi:MAG TPA: PilN domain-containing protein [Candidatus Sulfotelmatobacter sp.]|nr:PilN domain-containing protein [Candidatus Sulfotelmatobacter sp.]
MIQINLLPDVKLEFVRSQKLKRLILGVSAIACVCSIALLIVLLSVDGLQKKHLNDINGDISNYKSQLQNKPNISQILTVQNQLNSITTLQAGKPQAARVFGYLNLLTPVTVSLNSLSLNFTEKTMVITGNANNPGSVNQYVDNLKDTTYTSNSSPTPKPAFNDVVLTSFSYSNSGSSSQPASYTINLSYDSNIFSNTQQVKLSVPTSTTVNYANSSSDAFSGSSSGGGQ